MSNTDWFAIRDSSELATPALVFYRARLVANIRGMIAQAGGVDRLRPHIKTHKCAGVVRLMLGEGLSRFKCATIAEAELLGQCGASDVLLAYQLTGPHPGRLARLAGRYPSIHFSTVADEVAVVSALDSAAGQERVTFGCYLDLDPGLGRSGVMPGEGAKDVYRAIVNAQALEPGGLHVYDGHLRQHDPVERAADIEEAMRPVLELRDELVAEGWPVPTIVAGGTGSFPIHVRFADRQCSPGTCALSDVRSRSEFADIDYEPAAVVLTRVISKPGRDRLTLDLGHKAIASENPVECRVFLLGPSHEGFMDGTVRIHSEEHLTVETASAARYRVGEVLYGVPFHVCPTSALHQEALVVDEHRVVDRWSIEARDRRLSV